MTSAWWWILMVWARRATGLQGGIHQPLNAVLKHLHLQLVFPLKPSVPHDFPFFFLTPYSGTPFRSHFRIPVRSFTERSPSNASSKGPPRKKASKSNFNFAWAKMVGKSQNESQGFTCNQSHNPWLPKLPSGKRLHTYGLNMVKSSPF